MSIADFYDALAPFYHLNHADWRASIERQAGELERVLRGYGCAPPARVREVACGIGTQALGLAARGYGVTASGLSVRAVHRARHEARRGGSRSRFRRPTCATFRTGKSSTP